MPKINVLSKEVSELIAAGEVIERPVSVIKELVENSIDAGAKNITVEIKGGGVTFMRVTDDGCGISREDIPTAFLRHATSKVSASEDLEHIFTLGFRGEALASIAAVARVEMLTKRAEDTIGASYKMEGSDEGILEDAGCPDGTTIIIRDLFFNTPARLKFLKKDVSEGNSVQSAVSKLALAHPEVSIRFIRDNKQIHVTDGSGNFYSAIYSVFGKQFAASLIAVDFTSGGIKVSGYISSPLFSRGNRTMQHFFVNRRSVKSLISVTALEEGYRNSIMVGKFPACVLNIEINPSEVDVNVSPSKTEVRFADERLIFDAVFLAVKNAILNADNMREIKLPEKNTAQNAVKLSGEQPIKTVQTSFSETDENRNVSIIAKMFTPAKKEEQIQENAPNSLSANVAEFEVAPIPEYAPPISAPMPAREEPAAEISTSSSVQAEPEPELAECFRYISKRSLEQKPMNNIPTIIEETPAEKPLRIVGELFRTYIICEHGDEMVLIDKHAAHERVRFEKLKRELVQHSQLLAEAVSVQLDSESFNAVVDFRDKLLEVGIEIIPHKDMSVEVTSLPTMLDKTDPEWVVCRIAEALKNGNGNTEGELFDDILHSIACKSAIRANESTTLKELESLANDVWNDIAVRFCPHGRPVMTTLTKYEIEKNFNRV